MYYRQSEDNGFLLLGIRLLLQTGQQNEDHEEKELFSESWTRGQIRRNNMTETESDGQRKSTSDGMASVFLA